MRIVKIPGSLNGMGAITSKILPRWRACCFDSSRNNFVGGINMNAITLAIVAFFAIAIIVAIISSIWLYTSRRRTKELRSKFGPEYRRMAVAEGDAAKAEQVLMEREKRVKKLEITPLRDP